MNDFQMYEGGRKEAEAKQFTIQNVVCSACGEEIANHEKYASMQIDLDDVECISCENKYWDSVDIDNFG